MRRIERDRHSLDRISMPRSASSTGAPLETEGSYTLTFPADAHPDPKNGGGAPARIASERYAEALARMSYVWGHPPVNTVGRTSTWALMEGKG